MPLLMFLGGKWCFLKFILFGLGIYLITFNIPMIQILGGVTFGYALGKTVCGFMFYFANRERWILAEDLFNWDRITGYADE